MSYDLEKLATELDESFMRSSSLKLQGKLYSRPQARLEVSLVDELGETSGEENQLRVW